ncbi:MAG: hypothetical protein AAB649_02280 [Patescibacteria group bacterium]
MYAEKVTDKKYKNDSTGRGAIIVLGLLLVGTYGNSLTTMVANDKPLVIEPTPECVVARSNRDYWQDEFDKQCTPKILLPIPQVPSSECNEALIHLSTAIDLENKLCNGSVPRLGDDLDGVFEPPVIPPPDLLFATATPTPYTR